MNQLSMEIIRFNKKMLNHLFIYLHYFSPDNLAFFFLNKFYWRIVALHCCYFLLYSQVNQLSIYTYLLPFGFPSHLGHIEHWIEFPVLCSRFSLVVYFIYRINCVYIYTYTYISTPVSQYIPYPRFLLGSHMFVLYVRVSVSTL